MTKPVGALMRGYALPCVLSLLTGALYNIVDQLFIANASYLGSAGNAANTVVFPLTVIALGIAVMLGDGCCAFVSLSLGGGEKAKAKRSVGNAVGLCLGLSFVLTAIYLICADPILALFGAVVNARVLSLSREYFFWITLGIPFYMFGQAMNPIIRADGSPRFAMRSTLAGAFLNVILDPIFIFCFEWGMMGAAVATVLGQVLTAALSLPREAAQTRKGGFSARAAHCGALYGARGEQLFGADLFGCGNGCNQQHGAKIQCAGPGVFRGGICADSHGSARHCDEIFSNCDFRCYRDGGGVHPDCRI